MPPLFGKALASAMAAKNNAPRAGLFGQAKADGEKQVFSGLAVLRGKGLEAKVFLAIIAFGLLARAFALVMMPDASMTDSLYHLTLARFIIQNHALPFQGIGGLLRDVPVPLYHFVVAIPFVLLPVQLNLFTARLFPLLFSAVQLLLSFVLLRRLFPKNWHAGMAFVAVQPLLIFFGALNYVETFSTCFVLLSFIVFKRFSETGRMAYLVAMPFVLGGMALSKETATILAPGFFIMFLYELWKKRPEKLTLKWAAEPAYFVVATVLLSTAWFLANYFMIGRPGSIAASGMASVSELFNGSFSFGNAFLFPLNFNAAFWNFLSQAFNSGPFGITPAIAFALFSLVTVPVLAIMVYGLALGTAKRDRPSVLVLLCSLTAFALLLVTSGKEVYIRVFVPMLPLFGIPLCNAFGKLEKGKLRNAFLALFALAAIYSAAFTSLYVMHYALDNAGNVPLYGFISGLPEGSTIVVHPNLFRQVEFITGRDAIAGNLLAGMDAAQIMEALGKTNATHVAISCGRELWSNEIVQQLVEQGFLHEVYRDECNTLYKIER